MRVTKDQIEAVARELQIAPIVLECFAEIETGWLADATRFEPAWNYLLTPELFAKKLGISLATEIQLQKFSWGPLQIMGSVARELGFDGNLPGLIYPELGLKFGGLQVLRMMKVHKLTTDMVSSYNQGHPVRDLESGKYLNQGYVDNFTQEWLRRGGHILNETTLVIP